MVEQEEDWDNNGKSSAGFQDPKTEVIKDYSRSAAKTEKKTKEKDEPSSTIEDILKNICRALHLDFKDELKDYKNYLENGNRK